MWVGEAVAEVLVRQGVQHLFGVIGGHVQGVIDWSCIRDIQFVQARHEQGAGYAADAYARLTRRPAVMAVTAGPGFLNAVSALRHAQLARSPVVCLVGGHPMSEDERRTVQELDTVAAARPVGKWAARCLTKDAIGRLTAQAFRVAGAYPQGVAVVEYPSDLDEQPDPASFELPGELVTPAAPWPDPDAVARLADLLLASQRPLLLGGEGAYWGSSGGVLELLDRLNLPACFRRLARGTIPEDHALAVNGGLRSRAIRGADLVVTLGMEFGWLEHFARWRTDARFVQVSEEPEDFVAHLPTELAITAASGALLTALASELGERSAPTVADGHDRKQDWVVRLRQRADDMRAEQRDQLARWRTADAIHPAVLVDEMTAALAPAATVILDSFTSALYGTDLLRAVRPAQILDAGRHAGLGHSIGMAIGAKLARPDDQVVALIGDGGIGMGGMDIETAVRYGVPIVVVISNNGTLGPGLQEFAYGHGWSALGAANQIGYDTTPDLRYDRAFAELGCHGVMVETADQIGPAIAEAVAAGRPAVVNVMTDPHLVPDIYSSDFAAMGFRHLPEDRVAERAKAVHFSH